MKILITGCKGQLGRELQRQLREEGCVLEIGRASCRERV